MAIQLPSFSFLAQPGESPIKGLLQGLTQGFSIGEQMQQRKAQNQKMQMMRQEQQRAALIRKKLSQADYASPIARSLATAGAGQQAFETEQAFQNELRATAQETRARGLYPLQKDKLVAETKRLEVAATGRDVTTIDKLYTSLDTAISSGDNQKATTLAGKISKEQGTQLPPQQRTRFISQQDSWQRVLKSSNSLQSVFSRTPGAVEDFKSLYRRSLAQVQSAMPGSALVNRMQARARDPVADLQAAAADMLAIDAARALYVAGGRGGKITEKDVNAASNFLQLNQLLTDPQAALQRLGFINQAATGRIKEIKQKLNAPIEDILQKRSKSLGKSVKETSELAPVPGARKGRDDKWYIPNPNKPGKYLIVK